MERLNLVLAVDSYKWWHSMMLPEGTQKVYSYFEARKGAQFPETVFFGLQAVLKKYFDQPVTMQDIEQAVYLAKAHFGTDFFPNRPMWERIVNVYNGKLPLKIKAVREGTPVPVDNVLMTIENTDLECAALTNYVETLLTHVWYPSTVATLSRETKKVIKKWFEKTGSNLSMLPFELHDFGARGVNTYDGAEMGGMAHLVNFMGTDTIAGMLGAQKYYDADLNGLAYSVPATEHSVMTARGPEGEKRLFGDLIKMFPKGILSVVIDSYDYRRFISLYAKELRNEILKRDGKLVFRPDSGNPVEVTLDVLNRLDEVFTHTINEKGFKKLDAKVGMLWGDGIGLEDVDEILAAMAQAGWAADNICFGMGGGLLQKVNRDTQRFAFKCCAQQRDGEWLDIFKDPVDATKKSKRGRLALCKVNGVYKTVKQGMTEQDLLETVYENGKMKRFMTFDQVRQNATDGV